MNEVKVVVDNNVFVAGLLGSPNCRQIIQLIRNREITFLISPALVDELFELLSREKFHNLITSDSIERLANLIKRQAVLVHSCKSVNDAPDPEDAIVLECLLASRSQALITGDKKLLALNSYGDIPILTPAQFLKRLRKEK